MAGRSYRAVLTLALLCACACTRSSPRELDRLADSARTAILRGELTDAQSAIERGMAATARDAGSPRAWTFRLLQAELLIEQGAADKAIAQLSADGDAAAAAPGIRARHQYLLAKAQRDKGQLEPALDTLQGARADADAVDVQLAIDWLLGQVRLRMQQWDEGEALLNDVVRRATREGDRPQLAQALNDLGMSRLRRGRYDEALGWFERVLALSDLEQYTIYAAALSNAGVCYSRLGQLERAVTIQRRAIEIQRRRGDSYYLEQALGGLGNTMLLRGEPAEALPWLREAFEVAQRSGRVADAAVWARNLASAHKGLSQWDEAERFNEQSAALFASSGLAADPSRLIIDADIAQGRGDLVRATALLDQARSDPAASGAVRWSAEAQLAAIAMNAREIDRASKHFASALAQVEKVRMDLNRTDFKLSFLPRQVDFYQDYVSALVEQGQSDRALEVADSFRGRVLSEAQRVGAPLQTSTRALRRIAGTTRRTLLSYWVAPKRSYLWVITGAAVRRVDLPPGPDIEAAVRDYRALIDSSTADPLARAGTPGDRLFQMLVAPAALPRGTSAIVVPDGVLNAINFETLPVDGPERHYWIEDVEIEVAPSLALLTMAGRSKARDRALLLIGNPTPRAPEFPALSYAPAEMTSIVRHFPREAVTAYDSSRATPQAYRDAPLDRFSMIHFTAHATANVESPLDSAVILSGPDTGYKLYARDVADKPLAADLVTVSACRSAGERTYSGEGLVGFAWAFLRAGAHRVIAGLWDVDDRSTARLMDDLYGGLEAGRAPSRALRDAKLALIRSGGQLARPYYWGPFQLFTVTP
jgi:tetratricopeptide (TPR) repeat protein